MTKVYAIAFFFSILNIIASIYNHNQFAMLGWICSTCWLINILWTRLKLEDYND